MDDLWNRMRSRAGQAAFEAEKMRQITALQLKIRTLRQQGEQAAQQAGTIAYQLYRAGQVTPPALQQACAALDMLETQIATHEQEIEQIRAQPYVAPAAPMVSLICPQGHGVLLPGDSFCQQCGARGVMPASNLCPHCHAPLPPNARFCTVCGNPVAAAAPPPPSTLCPQCRQPITPTIHFCTNCGYDLRQSQTRSTPSPIITTPPSSATDTPTSESWLNEEPTPVPPQLPWPENPALPVPVPSPETEATDDAPTVSSGAQLPLTAIEEIEQPPALPDQTTCPVCGHVVAANVGLCTECGHPLGGQHEEETIENKPASRSCPVCHSVVAPGAVFCTGCGHYLGVVTGDLGEE